MKTSVLTLAAVLTLTATLVFAGNKSMVNTPAGSETIALRIAPVTPVEADFEEMVPVNDFRELAPTTPAEATFEEVSDENTIAAGFAPETPKVADFEDVVEYPAVIMAELAPVTPAEADFE